MTESEKHKQLKLLGKVILKDKGYKDEQIFEEYSIQIGKRNYTVDVCGIRSGSAAFEKEHGIAHAVECGTTNFEKLIALKTFFNEVMVLPYGITSLDSDLRTTLEKKTIKITSLEKEIKKLKTIIYTRERDIENWQSRRESYDEALIISRVSMELTKRHYHSSGEVTKKVNAILDIIDGNQKNKKAELGRQEEIAFSNLQLAKKIKFT